MSSLKNTARLAGVLYLIQAFTAPINLMVVLPKLIVIGDAAATANNIRSSENLFRVGLYMELLSQAAGVFIIWALYRLLKDVDRSSALLMTFLALASASVTFANTFTQIGALIVLSGADFLSVFAAPQLDAIAYLFLRMHGQGVMAVSIFWGLWLFPFGLLVWKSRFIPKIIGLLLILNGFAYVIASVTFFLLPQYKGIAQYMLIPEALGEPVIVLWLLIKGVRELPESMPQPSLATV